MNVLGLLNILHGYEFVTNLELDECVGFIEQMLNLTLPYMFTCFVFFGCNVKYFSVLELFQILIDLCLQKVLTMQFTLFLGVYMDRIIKYLST